MAHIEEQPTARKLTPSYKAEQRIRRAFSTGIRSFNLIEQGDHILLGLSGGKDSLALLHLLSDAMRRSGGKFQVSALHVRMDNINYRTDCTYLQEQADMAGVPLYIGNGRFDPDRNERRSPCFLCSWHRRKLLFAKARELGCNKIALGHHQDDILRTALMNLTFSGSFSTMPARLSMRKFAMTIIRPLCMVHEADLKIWADANGYRPIEKECPYDKASNRTTIGRVFEEMEALNVEARYSLWHALIKSGKLIDEADTEETANPQD